MFYFQTRYSNKLNRKFWWLYPNLTSLVHQNKQVYFVKILKTQLHPSSGILETGIEYDCKFCDLVTHGALRSSHELVEKCPCVPNFYFDQQQNLNHENRPKKNKRSPSLVCAYTIQIIQHNFWDKFVVMSAEIHLEILGKKFFARACCCDEASCVTTGNSS